MSGTIFMTMLEKVTIEIIPNSQKVPSAFSREESSYTNYFRGAGNVYFHSSSERDIEYLKAQVVTPVPVDIAVSRSQTRKNIEHACYSNRIKLSLLFLENLFL
uniref:KTSC domain-containing protein n=1 Tax=Heterorhabditis bacteriophora TaxID=37862 RepID=A0A1I7WIP7_HETBA